MSLDTPNPSIVSNNFGEAPRGKRFLAAILDLFLIPVVIGFALGILLIAADPVIRNFFLIIVNFAWTALRDITGAGPGKRMAGLKVIDEETGEKPSLGKLVLRNILILIPFVLVIGILIELVMVFFLNQTRLGDRIAKTKVVMA